MNIKNLIIALCVLNFIISAGCSSKDPEVEKIQAEISVAERAKRVDHSKVPNTMRRAMR